MITEILNKIIKRNNRYVFQFNEYFFKIYSNEYDAEQEYISIKKVYEQNIEHLIVPPPVAFIKREGKYVIVTKKINGLPMSYIIKNFLRGNLNQIKYIILMGRILKKMHDYFTNSSKIDDIRPCKIAYSAENIYAESIRLYKTIMYYFRKLPIHSIVPIKNKHTLSKLLSVLLIDKEKIDPLLKHSLVHGELYYTHIYVENKRDIILLDFGFSCRGPRFIDIAVFPLSIHLSLEFIVYPFIVKDYIRFVFLIAYFGEEIAQYDLYVRILEIYILLRILSDTINNYLDQKAKKNYLGCIYFLLKLVLGLRLLNKYIESALKIHIYS